MAPLSFPVPSSLREVQEGWNRPQSTHHQTDSRLEIGREGGREGGGREGGGGGGG